MAKGGRRSKSKGSKNGHRNLESNQNSASDDESVHDGSVTSYQSSRMIDGYNSADEDNGIDGCGPEEGSVYVDDFEDKLIEAIDTLSETSSLKGRVVGFNSIIKAFTTRYLYDFVQNRKITMVDMIERSLKRSKGSEEIGAASILAALTCVTLGPSDETELLMREVKAILLTLVNDTTVSPIVKSKIALSLGVITFITDDGTGTNSNLVMESMVNIFSGSFHKGNGVVPTVTPSVSALHTSALNTWTLLLTTCSLDTVLQLSDRWSNKIAQLLDSPDVDLRMSAGEALATIHEILVRWNVDFELDNCDELLEKLRSLATDSSKHRAKRDRRVQRSTFRDVVKLIERDEDGSCMYELVKFGRERLVIESWCKKRQYDSFCSILGPGMNLHLAMNDLLRDIFSLGEPLVDGVGNGTNGKVSKFERHMENLAIARARTKVRGKLRDKRADTEVAVE